MSDTGPGAQPQPDGGEPGREGGAALPPREPGGSRRASEPAEQGRKADRKRFWASRRVPSVLSAIVLAGLSGMFLYDVVSVRAGNKATAWRRSLAHQLATRHLDDTWVILGASVCAAVGLWLLVLSLTPGRRRLLPMARSGPAGARGGLDRRAARLVLRDRAMEVSGIRSAKVRVGRRRIKAHAASHFRELDAVRQDLDAAMAQAVAQLGLARPPRLRVRVQRAAKNA